MSFVKRLLEFTHGDILINLNHFQKVIILITQKRCNFNDHQQDKIEPIPTICKNSNDSQF